MGTLLNALLSHRSGPPETGSVAPWPDLPAPSPIGAWPLGEELGHKRPSGAVCHQGERTGANSPKCSDFTNGAPELGQVPIPCEFSNSNTPDPPKSGRFLQVGSKMRRLKKRGLSRPGVSLARDHLWKTLASWPVLTIIGRHGRNFPASDPINGRAVVSLPLARR
jgi:hypothetical protein